MLRPRWPFGRGLGNRARKLTGLAAVLAIESIFVLSAAESKASLFLQGALTTEKDQVATSPDATAGSSVQLFIGDARLAYGLANGILLGALYKSESQTGPGSSGVTAMAYGPSVGFLAKGLYILGTYFVSGSRTDNSSNIGTTRSLQNGYQIDLGYYFVLTNVIGLGPQISYRSESYGAAAPAGSSAIGNSAVVTDWRPMVAIWFHL